MTKQQGQGFCLIRHRLYSPIKERNRVSSCSKEYEIPFTIEYFEELFNCRTSFKSDIERHKDNFKLVWYMMRIIPLETSAGFLFAYHRRSLNNCCRPDNSFAISFTKHCKISLFSVFTNCNRLVYLEFNAARGHHRGWRHRTNHLTSEQVTCPLAASRQSCAALAETIS